MQIVKRDGTRQEFHADKINRSVQRACEGLDDVSASEIIIDAQINLFDGATTVDIDTALINSAKSKIEKEPQYAYAAARLHLATVYKDVFQHECGADVHRNKAQLTRDAFIINVQNMVHAGRLDERLMDPRFDLAKLADHLDVTRDNLFKYLGIQVLDDRYLIKQDGRTLETPQAFFMRVAMGLAINEDDPTTRAIEFYDVLSTFRLMTSTPTLFNSGTTKPQLSSCYLNTFDDSIDGIFDGLWQEARKSKYAGGLGYDLTPLRSRGSFIRGTNGRGQGAVYFWKLFNDMLVAVNQGGKRKGAGCGYLETWHGDIEDFLALRKNTGDERLRTHDMNTANWIPDLFMKRVIADEPWTLVSPSEATDLHDLYGEAFEEAYLEVERAVECGEIDGTVVQAKDLWKKMLRAIFETGHPWITFKDPCNIRYPQKHEGVVHSSNLCTEIIEHTRASRYDDGQKVEIGETAVCNLASINLARHVEDGKLNRRKLQQTITTGMRMLDNVIDLNLYPTPEAANSSKKHRFVGLGSMGWQEMFYQLNISYQSHEALEWSHDLYEFISFHAIKSSALLAGERGAYPTYEKSDWSLGILPMDSYHTLLRTRDEYAHTPLDPYRSQMDWDEVRQIISLHGMRNALTMAIAPTATISYLTGTTQSIEPDFSVLFVYSTMSGEFTVINEYFVNDMKLLGKWDEDMVKLVKHVDGDLTLLPDEIIPPWVKDKYRPAFRQDQHHLIDCAAVRQKWIDQSISLNLYNNETSLRRLHEMYMHAWKVGLKTTYYLRNTAASRVEKATVDTSEIGRIIEQKMNEPTMIDITNIECEGCQ